MEGESLLEVNMLGIIFALLSALLFGANYVLAQIGMRTSPKDNGVYLSIMLNVVILSIVYVIFLLFRTEPIPWKRSAILGFVIAGLFTTLLGRSSLFAAIRRIGSSRAAAIKNGAPIFTIIGAMFILGEKLSWLAGLGIAMVLAGLFFLAYPEWKLNGNLAGSKFGIGLAFAALSALSFGLGQTARKFGLVHMADPVLGALIGSIIAFIGFSCTLIYKKEFKETFIAQYKNMNKYFLWAGVASSFALLCFFMSANYIHISYTSAVAASEPVMTVILAYFFLKKQENIKKSVVLSILFVFLGIVVISLSTL